MKATDLKKAKLPDAPGVYFFKKGAKILYVGKATSLKQRVRSYFSIDLMATRGERIVAMVQKATSVNFEKTDSVLEALLLEAQYIKRSQPTYNVREKDNKSYNYIIITKESFPRILIIRGRELHSPKFTTPCIETFGPYTEGKNLKNALVIIRKIFPFRDSCTPDSGKPCFNAQIKLCPGVCSGTFSKQEYQQQVLNIRALLRGKKKLLLKSLQTKMNKASKDELYEEAKILRAQVMALRHIHDVSLIKNDVVPASDGGYVKVESYDISHTSGTQVVGVMVAYVDNVPDKNSYRKFILKTQSNDDIQALKEVLQRRFSHPEWTFPSLIVIDGGETHRIATEEALRRLGYTHPVVSVLKDSHHKPLKVCTPPDFFVSPAEEKNIFAINAETHRFAIAFHRRRRTKTFLHNNKQ